MPVTKTKCGRCKTYHSNMAEIGACLNKPLPVATRPPRHMSSEAPATEKQKDFVISLLNQLGKTESDLPKPLDTYGLREVSPLIDELKAEALKPKPAVLGPDGQPLRTTVATPSATVDEGMYRNPDTGVIYKVQRAVHGSGQLYAKVLRVVREAERDEEGDILTSGVTVFDYAPGVLRTLNPRWRMTLEQAVEFGALYGTCVRCGRTLTKEKSIERAMGPICAGKL